jgi:SAM-dependent methyltransferase
MAGYNLLSKIYRELLEPRGFFIEQHKLLLELCDIFDVQPNARILDAACGTGDVAVLLEGDGYEVFGNDGSSHQLSQWPQAGKGIERACHQWEAVGSYFESQSNFDTVYVLGHSLPHLSLDKLPLFLKHIHDNLNSKGLFVFDVRQWDRCENGALTQENREIGVMRYLTNVHIDGVQHRAFETVEYEGSTQFVTYTLQSVTNTSLKLEETLSYHMYQLERCT